MSSLAHNPPSDSNLDLEKMLDTSDMASITPDTACPSGACWLQAKLGANRAVAFDVVAACSGFIFGLSVADQYLRSGAARTVLLVASEVMSRTVNWQDRQTCILWGDGAGAAVLRLESGERGVLSIHLHTDGSQGDKLQLPGGGSRTTPISHESVDADRHTKYGNISSATVPIALDEAHRQGRLRPGDLVLLAAFGGGLAWGSALIRW